MSTLRSPQLGSVAPPPPRRDQALDPANQSLADALRRSFGVLKLLMLVLVVLYFLSGWFSVKPNEVGVIMRYGRVVGTGPAAVLQPRWYWSWPYPFEQWVTVSTSEREMPIEFMFQLSDQERATGISGYKYDNLSPLRDDYLITGDVNILHASLVIKYHVTDAIAYLSNVHPMPMVGAGARAKPYQLAPEYAILSHLARDAVIETAAGRHALDIRGSRQDEFLLAVAARLSGKLKELERAGFPLGISIDPNTGVLAPKSSTVEAIMPPRQTQEIFDRVFSAQTEKSVAIAKASTEAQERLLQAAGLTYAELADAVGTEFQLMLELSEAQSSADVEVASRIDALSADLARQRELTESLLAKASGEAQGIIKSAQIKRDRLIKEASADYDQYQRLLPEYLKHPEIFTSRLRDESLAKALDSKKVGKILLPEGSGRFWLKISRGGAASLEQEDKGASEKELGKAPSVKSKPAIVMPS